MVGKTDEGKKELQGVRVQELRASSFGVGVWRSNLFYLLKWCFMILDITRKCVQQVVAIVKIITNALGLPRAFDSHFKLFLPFFLYFGSSLLV